MGHQRKGVSHFTGCHIKILHHFFPGAFLLLRSSHRHSLVMSSNTPDFLSLLYLPFSHLLPRQRTLICLSFFPRNHFTLLIILFSPLTGHSRFFFFAEVEHPELHLRAALCPGGGYNKHFYFDLNSITHNCWYSIRCYWDKFWMNICVCTVVTKHCLFHWKFPKNVQSVKNLSWVGSNSGEI